MLMNCVEVNVLGQHWARDNVRCVGQMEERELSKGARTPHLSEDSILLQINLNLIQIFLQIISENFAVANVSNLILRFAELTCQNQSAF